MIYVVTRFVNDVDIARLYRVDCPSIDEVVSNLKYDHYAYDSKTNDYCYASRADLFPPGSDHKDWVDYLFTTEKAAKTFAALRGWRLVRG